MKAFINFVALGTSALIVGCAAPTKYSWGSYEPALYQHYKAPAQMADLETELARTIQQATQKGEKVPPGIYAEYGFVLQQRGKLTEAAAYYQKERQAWPESAVLMNTMLQSLELGSRKSSEREANPK
jgi:hypothetical protein